MTETASEVFEENEITCTVKEETMFISRISINLHRLIPGGIINIKRHKVALLKHFLEKIETDQC